MVQIVGVGEQEAVVRGSRQSQRHRDRALRVGGRRIGGGSVGAAAAIAVATAVSFIIICRRNEWSNVKRIECEKVMQYIDE